MSMNFNVVQKNNNDNELDEDELIDENEIDDDLEEVQPSSSFDPKKKMIKFIVIIMGVTIGLLFIMFVISSFSNRKQNYSYADVESIMKDAAISYFKDFPDYLPKQEGGIVEVDVINLVSAGKMSNLSEYLDENVSCAGSVKVQMFESDYLYSPYLNCENEYSTVELYKKIISENNVATSGYGLYSNGNNGYIFRGELVNNYVKLDKKLWRVVKITSNNNLVLVSDDVVSYGQPWDDRFNVSMSYEAGINQYSASRIKEYLEKIYTNPDKNANEVFLSKNDKSKIVPYSVCVGKRNINSELKDNSEECKSLLNNQKVGLLTLSDYIAVSIDPNCKSASTESCKNYNYLVIDDDWWLVTAGSDDTYSVYQVSRNGSIKLEYAGNYGMVRPVIYLNSNVLYKSGKGTLKSPYKVR